MAKFHRALLLLLAASAEARNLAVTSDGVVLATVAGGDTSLVTYDASLARRRRLGGGRQGREVTHEFAPSSLPGAVVGFDDVAVDPGAAAGGSTAAFAIDATSGIVCSFNLSTNSQGVSLDLIGCTSQGVNSSPFVGIAAMGGTLVVSGGIGGVSVFTYNEETGELSNTPAIRNNPLGVIGAPDVTMVTPQIAAFSADVRQGGVEFAVVTATIDLDSQSMSRDRVFPTEDSVGFNFIVFPASFPLTSSVYSPRNPTTARKYLYVANGGITVQDPEGEEGPTVVTAAPSNFRALTVGVNSELAVAVFGGIVESQSAYVVLDISDPMDPSFLGMQEVSQTDGRITGVAPVGGDVLYVTEGSSSILRGPVAPPTACAQFNEDDCADANGGGMCQWIGSCPNSSPAVEEEGLGAGMAPCGCVPTAKLLLKLSMMA